MSKGRKPLLVALLAVALMAVGLGSTASASDFVYSVEGQGAWNWVQFSIDAEGQSDLTATGTMEYRYQSGDFVIQAEVACLYVDPERHLAFAAGPATYYTGPGEHSDGMVLQLRDSPDGDGFMPGEIGGLENVPGYPDVDWVALYCGNELYQEHLGDSLYPLMSGEVVISGIDSIDDVLGDFDVAVAVGDLTAVGGQGNLTAFRNKLTHIARWLDSGNMTAACDALWEAQERSDGLIQPKDWVQGTTAAMEKLAAGIAGLIAQNGC